MTFKQSMNDILEAAHKIQEFRGGNSLTLASFLREVDAIFSLTQSEPDAEAYIYNRVILNKLQGDALCILRSLGPSPSWEETKEELNKNFGVKEPCAQLNQEAFATQNCGLSVYVKNEGDHRMYLPSDDSVLIGGKEDYYKEEENYDFFNLDQEINYLENFSQKFLGNNTGKIDFKNFSEKDIRPQELKENKIFKEEDTVCVYDKIDDFRIINTDGIIVNKVNFNSNLNFENLEQNTTRNIGSFIKLNEPVCVIDSQVKEIYSCFTKYHESTCDDIHYILLDSLEIGLIKSCQENNLNYDRNDGKIEKIICSKNEEKDNDRKIFKSDGRTEKIICSKNEEKYNELIFFKVKDLQGHINDYISYLKNRYSVKLENDECRKIFEEITGKKFELNLHYIRNYGRKRGKISWKRTRKKIKYQAII